MAAEMATQRFQNALAAIQEFRNASGDAMAKSEVHRTGGATQLYPPGKGGDSLPAGGFAGSEEKAEDEEDDGISATGMNYLGKSLSQVQHALGEKLEKGGSITGHEVQILRGIDPGQGLRAKLKKAAEEGKLPKLTKAERWALEKGAKAFDGKESEDEEKKEKEKMAKAQQYAHAVAQAAGRPAVDASPVLQEMIKASVLGTQAILEENALLKAQVAEQGRHIADLLKVAQAERQDGIRFRKAAADLLADVGESQRATVELLAGAAQAPSGGPRAVHREAFAPQAMLGPMAAHGAGATVIPLQKGGAGGGDAEALRAEIYGGSLRKAATSELLELVKAGNVHPDVVSKFEIGVHLDQQIEAQVIQRLQSRGAAA